MCRSAAAIWIQILDIWYIWWFILLIIYLGDPFLRTYCQTYDPYQLRIGFAKFELSKNVEIKPFECGDECKKPRSNGNPIFPRLKNKQPYYSMWVRTSSSSSSSSSKEKAVVSRASSNLSIERKKNRDRNLHKRHRYSIRINKNNCVGHRHYLSIWDRKNCDHHHISEQKSSNDKSHNYSYLSGEINRRIRRQSSRSSNEKSRHDRRNRRRQMDVKAKTISVISKEQTVQQQPDIVRHSKEENMKSLQDIFSEKAKVWPALIVTLSKAKLNQITLCGQLTYFRCN